MITKFRYNNMPVPAKASLWYTICNFLQKGISFIVIPFYTRLLTTSEYGQYSVFQSWKDILIIFATLNLYCGVFTKAMVDYEDDRLRYTSCMQGLSSLLTGILFIIYLMAHNFWNDIFEMNTMTMLMLFAYFIFYPSFSFWCVKQRVEYKYKSMIVATLMVSIATPIISIALLMKTNLRGNAIILGYLIVQIFIGAVLYIYQFYLGRTFYNRKYWSHALKFNIPLIPHYLSLIILGQVDRIMIKEYCGNNKAGIYNLAYQVSMIMNVVIGAINGSLVPWTYEKLKIKEFKKINVVTKNISIMLIVITMGIIAIAPEIILILGTREYMEAKWVIPAVAISVYFTFSYGLFSNIEFYFSATKFVMFASSIGAVLNIVLNALFIPIYGFIAAGYTTMICYFVFMIMHYIFMKKLCEREIGYNNIYDIKFIFLSSALLFIYGLICIFIYNLPIVRYSLLISITIAIYIKRKAVLNLLKTIRK